MNNDVKAYMLGLQIKLMYKYYTDRKTQFFKLKNPLI